ncbi:tRNA pseudouridine(55) synthase TruB [Rikenellaceae bacterium DSM 108975]|nr:tRNA pseudouridine(55) synthase TruB [Gallalistipes aquisgranensis]
MVEKILSKELDFPEGAVIPVDKPLGWTSADVVRKVKVLLKHLGYRKIKIGHAGTLDPLASGVLILCVGKATKQAEALQAEAKEYVAEFTLGATTPSFDMEHPVDRTYPWEHITREMTEEALRALCGERLQTPPVYSAKMIEGKRAYEYARAGREVAMRRALITVYSMEILRWAPPAVEVRIACSKGTYIRSIAQELGEKLGSGAYLSALCRTRSGNFRVEECYALEEIEKILGSAKQN